MKPCRSTIRKLPRKRQVLQSVRRLHGNRSDYALAPPTHQNLHNMGDGGGGFTSLIFNKTAQDQFRFDGGFRGDFYQVPNDPDQQAMGIRDRDREQDGFAIGSWTHSFG